MRSRGLRCAGCLLLLALWAGSGWGQAAQDVVLQVRCSAGAGLSASGRGGVAEMALSGAPWQALDGCLGYVAADAQWAQVRIFDAGGGSGVCACRRYQIDGHGARLVINCEDAVCQRDAPGSAGAGQQDTKWVAAVPARSAASGEEATKASRTKGQPVLTQMFGVLFVNGQD